MKTAASDYSFASSDGTLQLFQKMFPLDMQKVMMLQEKFWKKFRKQGTNASLKPDKFVLRWRTPRPYAIHPLEQVLMHMDRDVRS